jgi:chromate reductase, NAD(P)H dehydrogenase (quinone)
MKSRDKILAISGSTRQHSSNLNLILAISELFGDQIDIAVYKGISGIPHFNPDLDTESPPIQVVEFRRLLREADGILICTPEYAMGVPGTLKNAIDWTVSSMEFTHKPCALITASSSGHKAHLSLIDTLKIIEADIPDSCQLLISFVKTKIKDREITDPVTREMVIELMDSLRAIIQQRINNT